jgi:hypothetical protein
MGSERCPLIEHHEIFPGALLATESVPEEANFPCLSPQCRISSPVFALRARVQNLVFTTEAQRAQSEIFFARSGDGDRAKERSPSASLRINPAGILHGPQSREPATGLVTFGEAGGFFSLAVVSRPGKIRIDSSVSSVSLWLEFLYACSCDRPTSLDQHRFRGIRRKGAIERAEKMRS